MGHEPGEGEGRRGQRDNRLTTSPTRRSGGLHRNDSDAYTGVLEARFRPKWTFAPVSSSSVITISPHSETAGIGGTPRGGVLAHEDVDATGTRSFIVVGELRTSCYTTAMVVETRELDQMVGGRPSSIPLSCLGCGYDLTGAISVQCPECGRVFVAKEWRQKVAEIEGRAHQIKEANEWAGHAFKLASASLAFSLISLLVAGSRAAYVLRVLAVLGAFPAVFLGLGTFRAQRLPAWTHDRLALSPYYALALGTVLFGGIAVVLAVVTPW